MSLKGVELQIAVPKTYDAGKVAEAHQQSVIQQQYQANDALKKDIERKRLAPGESEGTEKVVNEEEKKEPDLNYNKKDKKDEKEKKEKPKKAAAHPFVGNFIDYRG